MCDNNNNNNIRLYQGFQEGDFMIPAFHIIRPKEKKSCNNGRGALVSS